MGSPQVLSEGSRLGPYELIREVGKGGFASVWLARRSGPGGLEVRVAVKLIRDDLGKNPESRAMFLDEARLVAGIKHPNVVAIFEHGEHDGRLYLVMEYVRGRSLSTLRELAAHAKRPIPVGIVMRILADTCAGLHAAHELMRDGRPLHVIHRDVSPQNILVSELGATKLIDFGVAKANERLAKPTAYGIAKGKLRYMAPEQAVSHAIDRRADIFGVGAVGYDLIEGHPPFHAPTDAECARLILGQKPVPPFTAKVPPAIEVVLHIALARRPIDRFATAEEMGVAIERAIAATNMKATSADVAAFFGPWLAAGEDGTGDPSSDASTLRILRAKAAEGATTTTIDVPITFESEPPKEAPP